MNSYLSFEPFERSDVMRRHISYSKGLKECAPCTTIAGFYIHILFTCWTLDTTGPSSTDMPAADAWTKRLQQNADVNLTAARIRFVMHFLRCTINYPIEIISLTTLILDSNSAKQSCTRQCSRQIKALNIKKARKWPYGND